jgi:hypothetical protein
MVRISQNLKRDRNEQKLVFFHGITMQTCTVTSVDTLMQHKTRKCADRRKLDFPMMLAFFNEKCCQHMSPFTRYVGGSHPRYVTAS